MNLDQAKGLKNLVIKAQKELNSSKKVLNETINSMKTQGPDVRRYVSDIEADRDKLFKFAETHTKDEVREYADKILAKWQSK